MLKKILRLKVADYINYLLSIEEYSFSWTELLDNSTKTVTSLKRELSRLVKKGRIVNLRKEFYLIITPRYSKQEKIPIQLYIGKLSKVLSHRYYLGFYSAAKFHGASHQQIQREYVMIENNKLGDINKKALQLRFFTTSKWPVKNIQERKSDAGIFKLSSPALTAVDLIHYQTKLGGLNRVFSVIEELVEEITINDMLELLSWYTFTSTLQRFGFVLEELQADDELIGVLLKHLESSKYYAVLLSPNSSQRPGSANNKWKVDINIKLESDL